MNITQEKRKLQILMHTLGAVPFVPTDIIFDYDSTIAHVPIDWPSARIKFRDYLTPLIPGFNLADEMRVDEMEAAVLQQTDLAPSRVFQYRESLESALSGKHNPIHEVVSLIGVVQQRPDLRLFIVSNNLTATVRDGLEQLKLLDYFTDIYGVDTVGLPKPDTKAAELLKAEYQVELKKTVFFGDSPLTDGLFCKKVGIHFINIKQI